MDQTNSRQTLNIPLNDLIGSYGLYHVNIMVFTMMRNVVFAIDIFSLALTQISTKEADILCKRNMESWQQRNSTSLSASVLGDLDPKCFYINNNNSIQYCEDWIFLNPEQRDTFTAQWNLVCHREWLAPFATTMYMFGILLNTCTWGYFGDKFGRWASYSTTHIGVVVFGFASLLAPTIYWFVFFRCCAGFCCVSYLALNTLRVRFNIHAEFDLFVSTKKEIEIMATKYRSYTNYPAHLGYGLGVILLAIVGTATNNWRLVVSIAPIVLAVTAPWLLFLLESIRWLTVKGHWDQARKEIKSAAKNNSIQMSSDFDLRIDQYFVQTRGENNNQDVTHASLKDLFEHRKLCFNIIIVWLSLFLVTSIYMMRSLNYSETNVSQMANFLISGLVEWAGIAVAGVMMHLFRRKTCLMAFVIISGIGNLLETGLGQTSNLLIHAKFLVYTLDIITKCASTSGYIVIFLMAIELFPTELRSVAQSMIISASAAGPLLGSVDKITGNQLMYSVFLAILSSIIVLLLKYFVIETKHMKLADTIHSISGAYNLA